MSTAISWSDETWNAITGCDRVSPGCRNCYALTMAKRLKAMGQAKYQNDGDPRTSGPGFALTLHRDALEQPLHWRKPRRIFVNSMSDLFHPDVPDGFIMDHWRIMGEAYWHQFQILTKRPQRMSAWVQKWADTASDLDIRGTGMPPMPRGPEAVRATYLSGRSALFADMIAGWGEPPEGAAYPLYDWMEGMCWWPARLPNVHVGTSIESDRYTFRADHLRTTPAAVRFLSLEPLLGPLPSLDLTDIHWCIVGSESGPGARPMELDWVRDIRDRCVAAGVPFFFKQRLVGGRKVERPYLDGRQWQEFPA